MTNKEPLALHFPELNSVQIERLRRMIKQAETEATKQTTIRELGWCLRNSPGAIANRLEQIAELEKL